ncbi:hypothetical protein LFZ50_02290 [Salmonella enterica subsp. arizonae serovar 53:-:- str. SA20100345]|nr:hypothetical protein LFZ50_02290 [Salmonella enterica subsp. arizonae serovar 53:-:- str. SA20100345]
MDSLRSLPSLKVHRIYNKSLKRDGYHVFMNFYYNFMI